MGQPSRPRYGRRRGGRHPPPDWEELALEFEQKQEYRALFARMLTLSARFQASLNEEQRRTWLELEDVLLEHAWVLHGEYFRAGYALGQRSPSNSARARGHEADDPIYTRRSQQALVQALAKLIQQLAWRRR